MHVFTCLHNLLVYEYITELHLKILSFNFRLRLARMNEEMRESEGLYGQPGQYSTNNHTEMQYKKCIQEFISLQLEDS